MSIPLEKLKWSLFCPFRGINASAEFTMAEKGYRNSNRFAKIRGNTYTSTRYSSNIEVGNIDIGSSDYLVFSHKDYEYKKGDSQGKVLISYPHIPRFIDGIADILEEFRDGCFEEREDGFILTKKGEDAVFNIDGLASEAFLAFQPVIFLPTEDDIDTGAIAYIPEALGGEPGIRMYLNGWDYYADTTLESYVAFIHFYQRFDLFSVAMAAAQIAVTHSGGVYNARVSKESAPQPTRVNSGSSTPLKHSPPLTKPRLKQKPL